MFTSSQYRSFSQTPNFGSTLEDRETLSNKAKIWQRPEGDEPLKPLNSRLKDITLQDVEIYTQTNYGRYQKGIFLEDRKIIERLIQSFTTDGLFDKVTQSFGQDIAAGAPLRIASIGQAELYPALLLNGLAKKFGTNLYDIELLDRIRPSRELQFRMLYGTQLADLPFQEMMWNKFGDLMEKKDNSLWNGWLDDLRQHAKILQERKQLPKNRYHAVISMFSSNLAVKYKWHFNRRVKDLVHSVKPGGLMAGAVMCNSPGWKMGSCWVPSLPITKDMLQAALQKAGVKDLMIAQTDATPEIRDNYDSIVVYSGIRK